MYASQTYAVFLSLSSPRPLFPFHWLLILHSHHGDSPAQEDAVAPSYLQVVPLVSLALCSFSPPRLCPNCAHSLVCLPASRFPTQIPSTLQALVQTCLISSAVLIRPLFFWRCSGGPKGERDSPSPEQRDKGHSQSRCLLHRPNSPQFLPSDFSQRTFWDIPWGKVQSRAMSVSPMPGTPAGAGNVCGMTK